MQCETKYKTALSLHAEKWKQKHPDICCEQTQIKPKCFCVEFPVLRYFLKMLYSCNINPKVILKATCTFIIHAV